MSEHFFDEEFLRRLERLALVARRASTGHTQGERRSPKRGQSVEFSDFRPYVSGDDFRRIDWNAYARLERFFIKLFIEEEDLSVHFLVDTSRSMDWGEPTKLWYAAHIAGALGYIALVGLDRVTVTSISGTTQNGAGHFPPHRGKRQALTLFNFLTNLQQSSSAPQQVPPTDPGLALRAYASTRADPGLKPGSLVLISDLMHDGWLDGLRALAARGFEITVIHLLAADEENPKMDGDLKLIDSEEATAVEITADYDLLARYNQSLDDWRQSINKFCTARGMLYVPLTTEMPMNDLIFSLLERRGVLR